MSKANDKHEKVLKNLTQIKFFSSLYGEECVKNIRFSCAYLFRIKVDDTYFLIKDEQRRNKFQPIGGVYKFTDSSIIDTFEATQCFKFRHNKDLSNDLRIIVPRHKARSFYRWYQKQTGRENIENLYREFKEEIIDRIVLPSEYLAAFKEISYRYCGENIVASTYVENEKTHQLRLQLHIADIVELILTNEQLNILRILKSEPSPLYKFATEEEIDAARHNKQVSHNETIISNHSYKILPSEERNLKVVRKKAKKYTVSFCEPIEPLIEKIKKSELKLELCNENLPFIFVSYCSTDKLAVYSICTDEPIISNNIWIDKKNVCANWSEDINKALSNANCKLSLIFVNEEYLLKSEPCLNEASIIVEKNIPHVIYLIGLNEQDIKNLFLIWSDSDEINKERLRVFKKLFDFDNDSNRIKNTVIEVKEDLQANHTNLINYINKFLAKT